MQRVAYWLFPLIAVAVAIFIVVFMIQINSSIPSFTYGGAADEEVSAESVSEEKSGWLESFSFGEDKGYLYPVNELTLDLDAAGEKNSTEPVGFSETLKKSDEL